MAAAPVTVPPPDAGPVVSPFGSPILDRLGSAFSHPHYRNLWLGAFTSATGTWMQRFAQQWLMLTLTGSAFFLGLDTFLGEVPLLLFTLIGGVIADRHDRRYLLMGSQLLQMACALTLTGLVFWDVIEVRHILALSFISGLAQAFGGPAFQSLIPSLVPRRHLPNAIALNSIQFNLAQMVGPLLGGLVLTAFGLVACFGLNGVSFLVVIVVLARLPVPHTAPAARKRILIELRSGLSYVRHEGALLALTLLALATTSLALPIRTFLPLFATDAAHLSRMMTALGGGAVVGALVIAWLGSFRHMGRMLLIVQVVFGAIIATFARLPITWVSFVLLFFGGMSFIMVFALTNSLVQLTVPNELRGRVSSIYLVAFRGGMPIGSLAGGYFIGLSSPSTVLTINGALLALVAVYFLIRSHGVREL